MYEAAHVYPDGQSTAARFAHAAGVAGYDGIVVRAVDATPDYEAIRDAADVDVVDGAEVVAPDPEHASGAIGNRRPKHTLLLHLPFVPEGDAQVASAPHEQHHRKGGGMREQRALSGQYSNIGEHRQRKRIDAGCAPVIYARPRQSNAHGAESDSQALPAPMTVCKIQSVISAAEQDTEDKP